MNRMLRLVPILIVLFAFTILVAPHVSAAPMVHQTSKHTVMRTVTKLTFKNASLHYVRGYSKQDGWFCYGWANGVYHCTLSWRRENKPPYTGTISLNTVWVPNNMNKRTVHTGGASGAGGTTGLAAISPGIGAGQPCQSRVYWNSTVPSEWQVPPGCYGWSYGINPANYVFRPGFGWCNWWPEVMFPRNPNILNSSDRGSVPRVGAAILYDGGVQGAGGAGHYGYVIAIYPGSYWVLSSEMNFYWRGGGWQRVIYRYIHVGPGVHFIYGPLVG
jgi:hypothetical protein